MVGSYSKITRHAKKKKKGEYVIHFQEEKKPLSEKGLGITDMGKLTDKEIKMAILRNESLIHVMT